jgi:DNA replication protein DnaC
MGLIRWDVPMGDPRWGKLHRCPNMPIGGDPQHQDKLRKLSNLEAFTGKTLENFELARPGYTQQEITSLTLAFNAAEIYAQTLEGWLLLQGSYGTGKTHLAAAIGNARLQHGDSVLFVTTPDLLDYLRGGYGNNAEASYDAMFERVKDVKLLILDDLGVENPSPWAQEKLFQLLNYRYVMHKATIITTNADLNRLDPRLHSRLKDTNVVHYTVIKAPDYRSMAIRRDEELLSRLPMYAHMTFNNFDVNTGLQGAELQNLMSAMRFASDFAKSPRGWMVFTGNFGTGKTHLAAAIANFRQEHGEQVMFVTVADLLDYLKTTFNPDTTRNFDELFNAIRNVGLLVLDDLGNEASKPWAQEKLFQLLDYRYVAQLPTLITTAQQLSQLNARLQSRLLDVRLVRNVWLDAKPYVSRLKRNN